jgi:RNA polymerase sigma-70 factor (ECF subfamily)
MNDQEQTWVMQARRGDQSAFSRLVEAYQRPVFNLTYRMLGNVEEAEDAAQEAFLRAYSRLSQYDPEMKFSTWLFSIANHHCIDRLRKRRTTQISIDDNPVLQNLEGDEVRPEPHALQQEVRIEVQSLLERLAPEYRTPLVLRYWEEMSYEEIAEAMQVTVATVKSRLFRARQQLAAIYQQQEAAAPPPSTRYASVAAQAVHAVECAERGAQYTTMVRTSMPHMVLAGGV